MLKHFATLSAALLLAACATEPASSTEPAPEKVYRTGSNIPARDAGGVTTMSPEDMERARNAASGNLGRGKGN
jgi:uncharacterized lipoprotein YajG